MIGVLSPRRRSQCAASLWCLREEESHSLTLMSLSEPGAAGALTWWSLIGRGRDEWSEAGDATSRPSITVRS